MNGRKPQQMAAECAEGLPCTLQGGGSLDRGLVEELVTDAYLPVVAKPPAAQWPADLVAAEQCAGAPR
ncbi:hypothetical protein B7755_044400 [Streptomyces sp. NBS 14/10]|uniref:hypothetical protein n=1 Tax=Streptomyces sp. NBS 14/10 TaxID=1945643 RepID=UPI000B7F17AB|nr:hypothetical protein [Streptomyces sp. NBS 14/10]KAK1184519.1 hypothetical protein B7755_044400 [Streptomyces sp. NBS 14/10]